MRSGESSKRYLALCVSLLGVLRYREMKSGEYRNYEL